jgi:hypothetical protein
MKNDVPAINAYLSSPMATVLPHIALLFGVFALTYATL